MVSMKTRRTLQSGDTVFAYCRDSGGIEQERSVSEQVDEIRRYAADHSLVVARVYADVAMTGTNDNRPEFQAMIEACRHDPPPVEGILVWKLNRIGRDELDRQFYIAYIRRRGLAVRSISERMVEGPLAGPMEAMLAWHDEQFIKDLSADVRRGMQYAAQYRNNGRQCPAGYKREKIEIGKKRDGSPRIVQRWVVDPDTAPDVVEMFRMWASFCSVKDIHARYGLLKSAEGYRVMFRNPIYKGIVRCAEYQRYDESYRIVSDELWDAAQKRFKERVHPRAADSGYLLSLVLYCGICGHHMRGDVHKCGWPNMKGKERSNYYYKCNYQETLGRSCRPRVKMDDLDRIVLDAILEHLSDANIAKIVAHMTKEAEQDRTAAAIARIDRDIETARRAISYLIDLVEVGSISGADVRQRIKDREAEITDLIQQRAELVAHRPAKVDPERVRANLTKARDELRDKEKSIVRRTLRKLVERIILHEDGTPEIIYKDISVIL